LFLPKIRVDSTTQSKQYSITEEFNKRMECQRTINNLPFSPRWKPQQQMLIDVVVTKTSVENTTQHTNSTPALKE
jgi:hypothetical protein